MQDDKIKDAFAKMAIPEPSEKAREDTINHALNAYDKKNQSGAQGSSTFSRLMNRLTVQDRSRNMNKRLYYLGATTAMMLVVTTIGYHELEQRNLDSGFDVSSAELPVALKKDYINTESNVVSDARMAPQEQKSEFLTSEPAANAIASAPPPAPPAVMMERSMASPSGGAPVEGYAGNVAAVASSDMAMPYQPDYYMPDQYNSGDKFKETESNAVKLVSEEPVSTFSSDVDTASYSFVRRQLAYGQLPDPSAVRIEEMINYFDYDYKLPESKAEPFRPSVTVTPSPWNKNNKLIHIGIKGYDIEQTEKPRSNLVFLIDTSGSMAEPDKLPLLLNSFSMLVDNLDKDDTVSIVVYAGSAGTVLEPTKVKDKSKILSALGKLNAGGSTAGAAGIAEAYRLAEENFDKDGINRVILATDGDFNVGISDPEELKRYIEKKRESGVFLSVLGFGQGNYNDQLMQELAQNGNGNAAYIDNINEARKVLVKEASSTLFPIAKDVKFQIEFNPSAVSEYRLIGYETRMLNREDFNNDKIDAGEIGAGHAVTAIYEITPKGAKGLVDPSRYQKEAEEKSGDNDEIAFLKIRYKLPEDAKSKLMSLPITKEMEVSKLAQADNDTRFSIAVAGFGQLLKGEKYTDGYNFAAVRKLAEGAKGTDKFGYRAEFLTLVDSAKAAKELQINAMQPGETPAAPPPPVQPLDY